MDQIGDKRVQIFQSNRYLDQSALMTVCIERAQGQWVHILTGEDWLSPGFYDALRIGIDDSPEIGSAFCRFDYLKWLEIDTNILTEQVQPKNTRRIQATLESNTAGILTNWLSHIAVQDSVAFSAMIVKRRVYEDIGAFCPSIVSASTWEMCQRIAHHSPVWYEPQLLTHIASYPFAINVQHSPYGLSLAHAHQAIGIAKGYLGDEISEGIEQQARSAVAMKSIKIAQAYLENGYVHSAMANLAEGIDEHTLHLEDVNRGMLALFSRIAL